MKVKLQIWDTVGSEKFRSITSSYFKNTHAVILVYSTKESFFQILPWFICSFPNHLEFKYFTGYWKRENSCFDNLDKWIRAIEENASENIMVVLSAAKCDLENREVTKEQGKEKAEEMGFQFYETSSRLSWKTNFISLFCVIIYLFIYLIDLFTLFGIFNCFY